jgi:hypothetical protein
MWGSRWTVEGKGWYNGNVSGHWPIAGAVTCWCRQDVSFFITYNRANQTVCIAAAVTPAVRLPSLCHSDRYPWYVQDVPRNLRHTCSCVYASRCEKKWCINVWPSHLTATNILMYVHGCNWYYLWYVRDGFGVLVVSMLASGTQGRGLKPGRSLWIFTDLKTFSMPSSGGEVKESVPCPSFAECKRP